MIFKPTLILSLLIGISCFSQNSDDVIRLSKLRYMQEFKGMTCDSLREIAIIGRYCLNKDLQEIDSVMMMKLKELTDTLDKGQLEKLDKDQQLWEEHRRNVAEMKSEGLEGNALGAYYLHAMITLTKSRIKEIELLIEY